MNGSQMEIDIISTLFDILDQNYCLESQRYHTILQHSYLWSVIIYATETRQLTNGDSKRVHTRSKGKYYELFLTMRYLELCLAIWHLTLGQNVLGALNWLEFSFF